MSQYQAPKRATRIGFSTCQEAENFIFPTQGNYETFYSSSPHALKMFKDAKKEEVNVNCKEDLRLFANGEFIKFLTSIDFSDQFNIHYILYEWSLEKIEGGYRFECKNIFEDKSKRLKLRKLDSMKNLPKEYVKLFKIGKDVPGDPISLLHHWDTNKNAPGEDMDWDYFNFNPDLDLLLFRGKEINIVVNGSPQSVHWLIDCFSNHSIYYLITPIFWYYDEYEDDYYSSKG